MIPLHERTVHMPVALYRIRHSPAGIEEARTQVEQSMKKGFRGSLTSLYGALVLFTPKKDGGVRDVHRLP